MTQIRALIVRTAKRVALVLTFTLVGLGCGLVIGSHGEQLAAAQHAAAAQPHRVDLGLPVKVDAPAPAAVAAEPQGVGTDFGLMQIALPGGDWTQAQVTEVQAAADRVCEGLTAQVPVPDMVLTLTAQEGLTPGQAAAFVRAVSQTRC
jgi:hypothetical protein